MESVMVIVVAMFKIKTILTLSAAILFIPTPAKAEWVQMGLLKDNSEIYIDIDSATVKNSLVTFWQRRLFAIAQPDGTLTSDAKMVLNCNKGTIKTTGLAMFDSTGRVLFSAPVNYPPRLVNAHSAQANVADFLCRQ